MWCSKCNKEYDNSWKVCFNCGSALNSGLRPPTAVADSQAIDGHEEKVRSVKLRSWASCVLIVLTVVMFFSIKSGDFQKLFSVLVSSNDATTTAFWLGHFMAAFVFTPIFIGSLVFAIMRIYSRKAQKDNKVMREISGSIKKDINVAALCEIKERNSEPSNENKTWGPIIFGVIYILTGISAVLSNLYFLVTPIPQQVAQLLKYDPNILYPVECAFSLGLGVVSIFIGYNLIKRKELWRKIAIINCIVVIIYWLFVAFFFSRRPVFVLLGAFPIIDITLLVYLTRKKVRCLFN